MKKVSKKIWIPAAIVAACVMLFTIIFPIIWCCVVNVDLKISAAQIEDKQSIALNWETSKPVDKIIITVKHGSTLVTEQTITDNTIIAKGETEVDAFYGRMNVSIKIYRGGYFTSKDTKVNLSASEYNFAPLTATMPVTIFSLSLNEITKNNTIPTFAWFKRSEAWDWSNLPENVYAMPIASYGQITGNCSQKTIYKQTSKYIKELYEINKDSKFNLYYNDYFIYGWLQATVANGIPAENYKVYLLSDGTASFTYFNKHFNKEDTQQAHEEYEKMKKDYFTLKSQIAKRRGYSEISTGFKIQAETLREYAYIMAKEEPNVEWWLTRINGTIATANSEIYNEAAQVIKVKDLNTLLNAHTPEQKEEIKKLFNFNDSMFEKAEQENKKAMVILGTWTANEYNFKDYVKAVQTYYGDEFVYYYKGHPKNPTASENGKLEMLESIGLIDVDSTIPAELIIFFNPEVYMSGYSSSTYVALTDEEKCGGLFHATKDNCTESYKERMDFFISHITSSNDKYGSLVKGNDCYLLEFNDTTNYEIAIFNAKTKEMKFYNSSLTEVTK